MTTAKKKKTTKKTATKRAVKKTVAAKKRIRYDHSFTVKRSRWVNGSNNNSAGNCTAGDSLLLNKEGNMCCLGFLAKSCGLSDKTIKDHGGPDSLLDTISPRLKKKALKTPLAKLAEVHNGDDYFNTEICDQLITTNDTNSIDSKKREAELKKQFAKIKVNVKFVD